MTAGLAYPHSARKRGKGRMMDDYTQKTWVVVFELICLLVVTATILVRWVIL